MSSRRDQLEERDVTYELEELDAWKAWKRVGVRPESIVQWALGWLNQWPNSDSARLTLRQDIGALSSMSWGSQVEYWSDCVQKKLITREEVTANFRLPNQQEADRFLSLLSGCVEDLLSGSIAQVGPLSVSVYITRRDRKAGSTGYRKKLEPNPLRLTDEGNLQGASSSGRYAGASSIVAPNAPPCSSLRERTRSIAASSARTW